jgi:hypothetical protein
MVLKLSDLVKKSIDKGYGAASKPIEKPWTQGNLSMIERKMGNSPFVKTPSVTQASPVVATQAVATSHGAPVKPVHAIVSEEQPVLHASTASLKKQTESKESVPDHRWWERINFSATTDVKPYHGRLLVNYALLSDD